MSKVMNEWNVMKNTFKELSEGTFGKSNIFIALFVIDCI